MQRGLDGASGKKDPGSGLAEASGRGVAAAGLPSMSPSRLPTVVMPVHSVEEGAGGAGELESGGPSPRLRIPADLTEEGDKEGLTLPRAKQGLPSKLARHSSS